MGRSLAVCRFALNRVRTVLLALVLIIMMKSAWFLIALAG
jgi:hypothetical protein